MNRRLGFAVGIATLLAGAAACHFTLTPEALYHAGKGINDARQELTPENEYYVGRSVATNLLDKSHYLYLDREAITAGRLEALTDYVSLIGNTLVYASMDAPRSGDRPAPVAGWHFTILDDASINAFSAPGGYVFITKGAVLAAHDEDELAAVLAHEIAHVVRGHALGSISKSRWANVTATAVTDTVSVGPEQLSQLSSTFTGAMGDMINSIMVKGYSRDTEFEADSVGLAILAHAGYDPLAFTRFLTTLQSKQTTASGGFSSTHPKAQDRIAKLTSQIAKLPAAPTAGARTTRFATAIASIH